MRQPLRGQALEENADLNLSLKEKYCFLLRLILPQVLPHGGRGHHGCDTRRSVDAVLNRASHPSPVSTARRFAEHVHEVGLFPGKHGSRVRVVTAWREVDR
jgi:hypothetical protein